MGSPKTTIPNIGLAVFVSLIVANTSVNAGWHKLIGRPKSESSILRTATNLPAIARTHSDSEVLKEVSNLTSKINNKDQSVHTPTVLTEFARAVVHIRKSRPIVAAHAEAELAKLEASHSADLRTGLEDHLSKYVQDVTKRKKAENDEVNDLVARAKASATLDLAHRLPRPPISVY